MRNGRRNNWVKSHRVEYTSEGRSDKDRTLEKKASKRSPKGRSKAMSDSSTPAERYAIRRHLTGAQQCVAHMTEAATTSDPLKLADAGLSLRKRLRELWRLRKAR